MQLHLEKPIVFFDIEATGIDVVNDRIVEISLLKVHPNHKEEVKTFRVNPEKKISKQAIACHHITNEDVAEAPPFHSIAKEVFNFITGCDLAGYNSDRFDVPMLAEELLRADIDFRLDKFRFVDVQTIFHKLEQRNLSAAYKLYCGKKLINAHSAAADAKATYEILKGQLDRYVTNFQVSEDMKKPPIENNITQLSAFSHHKKRADCVGQILYDEEGEHIFNFGKYKGQKVVEVLKKDTHYYNWLQSQNFALYTKKVLTEIILKLKLEQ